MFDGALALEMVFEHCADEEEFALLVSWQKDEKCSIVASFSLWGNLSFAGLHCEHDDDLGVCLTF